MPVIHEYRDGRGLYILASHKRRITTYQVTAAGLEYLRKRGATNGSEISVRDLIWMRNQGFTFTNGTGAGDLPGVMPSNEPLGDLIALQDDEPLEVEEWEGQDESDPSEPLLDRNGNEWPIMAEIVEGKSEMAAQPGGSNLKIVAGTVSAGFNMPNDTCATLLIAVQVRNSGETQIILDSESVSASAFDEGGQLLYLDHGHSINGSWDPIKIPARATKVLRIEFISQSTRPIYQKLREKIQSLRVEVEDDSTTIGRTAIVVV